MGAELKGDNWREGVLPFSYGRYETSYRWKHPGDGAQPAVWETTLPHSGEQLPGLMLQKITTSPPDDSQLTVAMAALKAVLTPESDDFRERVYYDMPDSTIPEGDPA